MSNRALRPEWLALALSVVAALFSGMQWLATREAKPATYDTALDLQFGPLAARDELGIGLHNAGPGVAHIQSVSYYVDDKPIDDISDALDELGLDSGRDTGVDLDQGDFVVAHDVMWLIDYHARSRQEARLAADVLQRHVQVAVEYCDALGACRRICSKRRGCPLAAPGSPDAAPKSNV